MCLHPAHRSPAPHFPERKDTTDRELRRLPSPYPHPRTLPRLQAGEILHTAASKPPPSVQTSKTVQQLTTSSLWDLLLQRPLRKGKPAVPVLFSEACLLQTSSTSKGSQLAPKALESLQTVTPTTSQSLPRAQSCNAHNFCWLASYYHRGVQMNFFFLLSGSTVGPLCFCFWKESQRTP